MRLNQQISNRIAMLRPILIIGVVFVHIPGISDSPSQVSPGLFNLFAEFFKNGVFRGTVPTMSLIAGYLLFKSGLDQAPAKLFKKKLMTLLVPFIVFNVICFAFELAMHSVFPSAYTGLDLLPKSPVGLLSAVFGVYAAPVNAPLYFIRDLLVIIALVPLLGLALRSAPWVGLVAIAIICGTNADGNLLLRSSSLFLFYIGGAAAVYQWDLFALDKYAGVCLAAFAGLCVLIIGMGIDDNTFLVVLAPFLIWPAARLLQNTRIEAAALRLSKYSFFIFVGHMPLLGALWWLVAHEMRSVPYPLFWFAAPLIVCAVLKKAYDVASSFAPNTFNAAIGARVSGRLRVERRKTPRAANAPVYSNAGRAALNG